MTTKTRRKTSPVQKTAVLLTQPDQTGHQHALRIYVFDLENAMLGGETSHSTGDAENEEAHAHGWMIDSEGNLVIGEANDHTHEVDEMELSRALARLRAISLERSRKTKKADDEEEEEEDRPSRRINRRKARRRLKNAEITHVSLCRRGVNGVRSILKSVSDTEARILFKTSIAKMTNEGLLHTLVYLPDDVDHEEDTMTAEEVRKTAHGFLRNGGHIDIEHDGVPLSRDEVHIAEHYIVPPNDPKFAGITDDQGNLIDPTGAWGLILKIHDPDLLAGYELGEWIGVSMAGRAEVEMIGKSRLSDPQEEEDLNMTPEERKEFAQEIAKATATAVAEAIKPPQSETPPAAPAEPQAAKNLPEPPEDLDDPEVLEKYLDDLFVAELDLTKQSDVQKLIKHRREQAAKRAKAEAEAKKVEKSESGEGPGKETELEKAKRERDEAQARLEKLEKSSRQPGKDSGDEDEGKNEGPKVHGLNKSESKGWNLGKQIAERWNKSNRRVAV